MAGNGTRCRSPSSLEESASIYLNKHFKSNLIPSHYTVDDIFNKVPFEIRTKVEYFSTVSAELLGLICVHFLPWICFGWKCNYFNIEGNKKWIQRVADDFFNKVLFFKMGI